MRVKQLVALCFLIVATIGMRSGREDTLTPEQGAEILASVFAVRSGAIPDSARIDACSLFISFGQDPSFVQRLMPWVRARLAGEARPNCQASQSRFAGPGRWWVLRRIDVENGYKVTVRAVVYSGGGSHHEVYEVRRSMRPGPTPWGVDHVELSDFLAS